VVLLYIFTFLNIIIIIVSKPMFLWHIISHGQLHTWNIMQKLLKNLLIKITVHFSFVILAFVPSECHKWSGLDYPRSCPSSAKTGWAIEILLVNKGLIASVLFSMTVLLPGVSFVIYVFQCSWTSDCCDFSCLSLIFFILLLFPVAL